MKWVLFVVLMYLAAHCYVAALYHEDMMYGGFFAMFVAIATAVVVVLPIRSN